MPQGDPKISLLGTEALLFDVGGSVFDDAVQQRVWAVCAAAERVGWAREATPGMNNLMVAFDNRATTPVEVEAALRDLWASVVPETGEGRVIEAPTVYGGALGMDLAELARRAGLSIEATVQRHAERLYGVAAVGAMPGFVYLSDLDPTLAWPRLATPRAKVAEGSVIIGGPQTGVMPCDAPTGWHCIGHTTLKLFDPTRDEPATLRPGDRLRFVVEDIRA